MNAELQRRARDKKAFLSDQCKEIEENNIIGGEGNGTPLQYSERVEISSRKLEIPREHFMQRWAQ